MALTTIYFFIICLWMYGLEYLHFSLQFFFVSSSSSSRGLSTKKCFFFIYIFFKHRFLSCLFIFFFLYYSLGQLWLHVTTFCFFIFFSSSIWSDPFNCHTIMDVFTSFTFLTWCDVLRASVFVCVCVCEFVWREKRKFMKRSLNLNNFL